MTNKHCTAEDCKMKYYAKGFCSNHYQESRRRANNIGAKKLHGMCGTPTYKSWYSMKNRCYNKKHASFKYYGGRGITVCDEWKVSFINFLADMGEAPKGLTLDKIDNDKGYSKGNCRWATKVQQSNNTRIRSDNKSGIKGVYFVKNRNVWQVEIIFNNKKDRLGGFKNFLDACSARKSAELRVKI